MTLAIKNHASQRKISDTFSPSMPSHMHTYFPFISIQLRNEFQTVTFARVPGRGHADRQMEKLKPKP